MDLVDTKTAPPFPVSDAAEPELSAKEKAQLSLPFEAQVAAPAEDWRTKVPSVSQLTRRIRGHIENSFFDVWVKGEISNFRKPVSGHAYFVLKDATSQLKSVVFKGSLSKLKFNLADGMEILLHGTITVYEARGEYQIVADSCEPVGVGALQLAFEQLKAKLQKEGLFDPKYKKRLPPLPRKIGLITSPTGAAVRDILKVLSRRYPNLEILILPAVVQGDKAAGEIIQALKLAESYNTHHPNSPIDVIISGRGGGSLEDMWCFNDENLARAMFKCPIPLISAVGHEIDFTIADFVADVRAPTPSAAAEIVVPRKEELQQRVTDRYRRMTLLQRKRMEQIRLHLIHMGRRLVDPRQRIKNMKERFILLHSKLCTAKKTSNLLMRRRLQSLAGMLHSLSPLQTISRGYSLTRTEQGVIIRSISEVSAGTKLMTRVGDGEITSEVLSVNPEAR